MNIVIRDLKDLIKRYERERDENIAFFESDKFKSSIQEPVEENSQRVIEYTRQMFDGVINEFNLAISTLEYSEAKKDNTGTVVYSKKVDYSVDPYAEVDKDG